MTTIAYRDGVLAADSQHSSDGVIVAYRPKLERLPDGSLLATKGCAGHGRALFEWLKSGREGDQPDGDGGGFLVHADGTLEGFEGKQSEILSGADYHAFGSGQQIALGAMHAGATAEQAVAAAVAHDCFTGGEITVLRREA